MKIKSILNYLFELSPSHLNLEISNKADRNKNRIKKSRRNGLTKVMTDR